MTALEKYIWIVRTLYNKGDRGLSLKELNDKWIHDENISIIFVLCHYILPRKRYSPVRTTQTSN